MMSGRRSYLMGFGATVGTALVLALLSLLLWPQLLPNLLTTNKFEPHGACFFWEPQLVGLHSFSDTLIGFAYVAISLTLGYFVLKTRRDVPFQWVFVAFGVFIIACGTTHFMEVWTLWTASYWLSGGVKLVTAFASVATAIVLPPLIPQVLKLIEIAKLSEERRRKLEAANRELEVLYEKTKELDRLKTQFFANVSHELRTPLTLIIGPTRQMNNDPNLTQKQRQNLAVVERNAATLLRRVNDLLDFSRLEAEKLKLNAEDCDLAELVRLGAAHFDTLAEEKQITFRVEAPSALPGQVDPEKLQRVLLNLLSNAFKFTPEGGTIICTLSQVDGQSMITVQDSGPGVKPESRETIFERFQQGSDTLSGGTGLGLAIARDFVQLHGGTIMVEDSPLGGALFRVTLPRITPANPEISTMSSNPAIEEMARLAVEELRPVPDKIEAGREITPGAFPVRPLVLLVEDNPDMANFVAETLAEEYRVMVAHNGREGLEKARASRPDLILTDLMMPEVSGDVMVRELRRYREFENVPVIILTARGDEELRVRMLREGALDFLMKPVIAEELRARVRNQVKMKQTRQFLQQELDSKSQDIAVLASDLAMRQQEMVEVVKELQQSESRFRRLLESDIIGIIIANFEGKIVEANDAFLKIIGYSREELLSGQVRWDKLTPPEYEELDKRSIEVMLQQGYYTAWEKEYFRKDGSRAAILLGSALLEGSQDTAIAFILDISERKRMEQDLREAISARDEFLSVAAHELKTPVTSLRGYAQLLANKYKRGEVPTPTQVSRALQVIDRQSERLSDLIARLLDISRIQRGQLTLERRKVDLVQLVEDLVVITQPNLQKHTITVKAPEKLVALVDPGRFEQVFSNLLDNAIKYSPEGGPVEVILDASAGVVRLTVTDRGIGIPPERRDQIFERYYQAHPEEFYGGMGLGLYIVKQIVEQHGGEIRAEFPPERGTRIVVELPAETDLATKS